MMEKPKTSPERSLGLRVMGPGAQCTDLSPAIPTDYTAAWAMAGSQPASSTPISPRYTLSRPDSPSMAACNWPASESELCEEVLLYPCSRLRYTSSSLFTRADLIISGWGGRVAVEVGVGGGRGFWRGWGGRALFRAWLRWAIIRRINEIWEGEKSRIGGGIMIEVAYHH